PSLEPCGTDKPFYGMVVSFLGGYKYARADNEHRMGRRYAEVATECITAATNANAEAKEDGDSLETAKKLAAVM
ncbi:MAG: hypothetical protein M1835_003367, partial [Candelina submexicana]